MKLTKTQHNRIVEILAEHNRTADQFTFIKRKGRILINENHSENTFSYFRKKSAGINPANQKLESFEQYLVSMNAEKEVILMNWEATMSAFSNWLDSIENP